jgi:hypothetical protein
LRTLSYTLIALFLFSLFARAVYASDEVNLGDFPQKIADSLTLTLFQGQILASLLMLSLFLFPTLFICAKFDRAVLFPSIGITIMSLTLTIALGWTPYWILLIIVMLIALMLAGNARRWLSSGGED